MMLVVYAVLYVIIALSGIKMMYDLLYPEVTEKDTRIILASITGIAWPVTALVLCVTWLLTLLFGES